MNAVIAFALRQRVLMLLLLFEVDPENETAG